MIHIRILGEVFTDEGIETLMCTGYVIENNHILTDSTCCLGSKVTATFNDGNIFDTLETNEFELTSTEMFINPAMIGGPSMECIIRFEEDLLVASEKVLSPQKALCFSGKVYHPNIKCYKYAFFELNKCIFHNLTTVIS